jgi:hypothetical protein
MYFYPQFPGTQQHYSEYERDSYYFTHTLQALKCWNEHRENGERERPVIPEADFPNMASREVKQFFDTKYQPEKPLACEHFAEATDLLDRIIKTNGVDGMYSFFRVLSHADTGTGGNSPIDTMRFKKILGEVFVPHFEPVPTEEIVHGVATVGHIAISALAGLVHAPAAAYSVMRFRKLRNDRLERRETPPLEVMDHILPLLQSMHAIAQHSVDILNVIEPVKDRPFPDLAPIDTTFLQTALERTRHADDSPDQPHYSGR